MYKLFNTSVLTSKQRFTRAIIAGIVAAIGMAIILGMFTSLIRIQSSLLLVGVGYLIGMVIVKAGRGVQKKFSILGACCCVLSIVIADMVTYFGVGILFQVGMWPTALIFILQSLLNPSISGILGILFRVGAVGVAYQNSRIS